VSEGRARSPIVAAAVGTVVLGLIESFVTLPTSCQTSVSQLFADLPETIGLWVASMILWVGVLVALVVVFWRLQKLGGFVLPGVLVLAGAGLVGSSTSYYFGRNSLPADEVHRLAPKPG